jgi:hypothetical protein
MATRIISTFQLIGPVTIPLPKSKLKLTLSMDGCQSGDIEAKIFGAGVEETSHVNWPRRLLLPLPASTKSHEVKIGYSEPAHK